jgi:alpha-galactosidase
LGRRILGQPAAYGSAGGVIDVFVRGTDNHAYRRTFNGTSWGGWTALGGTLTDAPTAAYTSPTSWTLFARGVDGQVWSRGPTSCWTSIGAPGNQPIYGRPSAVTDANGTYVAVRTPDDQVWWRTADTEGTWSAWTPLGGVISGSPTLLATDGRVYLFARASDYTLWQRNFVGGAWGSWFPRGEFASNAFYGSLGAAAGANGSAWVALRGTDGHVHLTVL